MHSKQIVSAGVKLGDADKVLIMLHGRGASAEDILTLATHLDVKDYTLLAPQATNHTWYPFSFLAPAEQNEPWLSSALDLLNDLVNDVVAKEIEKKNIRFLGFSQGACLMLEFVMRNATRYGGIAAFTGGVIGNKINIDNYKGDFGQTPVFLGTSDPDPHIPVERFYATSNILKNMNAAVTEKTYSNMGHTINQDEIDKANNIVFRQ
ncbi:MAG: dienelactone hydrolase family protein [Chitinophagaceae bacterium]|nr:dienelactone hydrolase family protein [Chitinophagaceae bacterium]